MALRSIPNSEAMMDRFTWTPSPEVQNLPEEAVSLYSKSFYTPKCSGEILENLPFNRRMGAFSYGDVISSYQDLFKPFKQALAGRIIFMRDDWYDRLGVGKAQTIVLTCRSPEVSGFLQDNLTLLENNMLSLSGSYCTHFTQIVDSVVAIHLSAQRINTPLNLKGAGIVLREERMNLLKLQKNVDNLMLKILKDKDTLQQRSEDFAPFAKVISLVTKGECPERFPHLFNERKFHFEKDSSGNWKMESRLICQLYQNYSHILEDHHTFFDKFITTVAGVQKQLRHAISVTEKELTALPSAI